MNLFKIIKNGIIDENPIFSQVLGMCPTLAVTTSAMNGLGMGLATTAVLTMSNLAISLLRKVIPSKIRIPAYVVVIATFVTIVGMLLKAYVPALDKSLGLFIPLIVVNCIILARAESFASKNSVVSAAADGIGMGLGFALSLTLLGSVREILGAGSIFGLMLFGEAFKPAIIMILPPGAFLALGMMLAMFKKITKGKKNKKQEIQSAS
ncbi:putative inner membrane NADH-quinone reductase [Acetoanaerobium sticklandii]|uniref:Ion-translocating oxidoreductase complex subunit E n=1 Tax=Acetoanaerobium sticklandii (strain ATCC 12662 / DSM 519 / JCM 1433 / CCUG 9281 / NCIMB 10654 / HF) TaxID=499177 RepID=E3PRL5_ACESD|nr:electron transport complex subunit E [Acetoanaerobium sticklandii]CBH21519.1 putative inner membrane NADH-quinone reductase [Acetoanaerobium sticklandii]